MPWATTRRSAPVTAISEYPRTSSTATAAASSRFTPAPKNRSQRDSSDRPSRNARIAARSSGRVGRTWIVEPSRSATSNPWAASRAPAMLGVADVDEAVLERVLHQLGARRAADLLLDVRAVRLDRAHAQVEPARDLRVRVAERDQPQNLDLALGQVIRQAARRRRLGREPRAQPRIQVRLPLRGQPHRLQQLLVGRLLEHVAQCPGPQRLA